MSTSDTPSSATPQAPASSNTGTSSTSSTTATAPAANGTPSSSSDQFLKILIRNPTDVAGTPPYAVSVSPKSTVEQLKEQLSASYRGNPPISAQRLIFAGRLLQNSSTISSVIPNADLSASHTFHLVVSSNAYSASTPSLSSAPRPATSNIASTPSHALNPPSSANSTATSSRPPQPTPNPVPSPFANTFTPSQPNTPPTPTLPTLPQQYFQHPAAAYGVPATVPHFSYYTQTPPHFYAAQRAMPSSSSQRTAPSATIPPGGGASSSSSSNPNSAATASGATPGAATGAPRGASTTSSANANLGSTNYRAHLQTMEHLIAQASQWYLQAMAAETSAHAHAQARNFQVADQLRAHAAHLQAHSAALHAQAYAHARAQALLEPPSLTPETLREIERNAERVAANIPDFAGLQRFTGPTVAQAGTAMIGSHFPNPPQQATETPPRAQAQPADDQQNELMMYQQLQQLHQHLQQQVQQAHNELQQGRQHLQQLQQQHQRLTQREQQFHQQQQQAPLQPQLQPQQQQGQQQNQFEPQRQMGARRQFPNGINVRFARFPVDANGQIGEPRQFVFRFQLNWVLMFKLILFVYILGQDAGKQRMYLLMGLAVVIYMWKMGYLRFVRRAVEAALPDPRTLIDRLFPAGGGADPQAANVAQPTERRDGENQPPQQQENGRGQHRLGRIAVFLSFIYSFVYGFICSLLPAWNPEPHARLDELMPQPDANQNGDQDATQGDGQRQPNEIGHEHAD